MFPWQQPIGPFAEITAKAGRSALKGWRRMRTRLQPALDAADACCIVLGTGGLEVLEIIPENMPLYVYIHERNKGFTTMFFKENMDGKLRNSLFVKNLALSYLRRWDRGGTSDSGNDPKSAVSANTPTSSRLLASSHGWPTSEDWIAGEVKFRDEFLRPAEVEFCGQQSTLRFGLLMKPKKNVRFGNYSNTNQADLICSQLAVLVT